MAGGRLGFWTLIMMKYPTLHEGTNSIVNISKPRPSMHSMSGEHSRSGYSLEKSIDDLSEEEDVSDFVEMFYKFTLHGTRADNTLYPPTS